MENLGAVAYSQYTGFREITDCDVLELHCISAWKLKLFFFFYAPAIFNGRGI